MMDWPGHEAIWQEWHAACHGSRMHHAWLLAGTQGLGKRDFALAAAREWIAEPASSPPSSGFHPDIHLLTQLPKDDKEEQKRLEGKPYQTKRNITVGQIREMQARLTKRPTLGARRAIIIDSADDMEKSASNALLKSLEEPPQGTYFLLVTHRAGRLLATIRSRCRMLRFGKPSEAAIAGFLARKAPHASEDDVAQALAICGGSPGAALAFIEYELASTATLITELIEQGDQSLDLRARLIASIGARASREKVQAVLALARAILGQCLQGGEDPARQSALADAHQSIVKLSAEAPTYNFDPALLAIELGRLLARPSPASAA